jgi:hypothetical protein
MAILHVMTAREHAEFVPDFQQFCSAGKHRVSSVFWYCAACSLLMSFLYVLLALKSIMPL